MFTALCRGCGMTYRNSESEPGFCPRCRTAYGEELFSLYRWMREQTDEAYRRRSVAFARLLLPTYRFTLTQSESLRRQMLYPEWLSDHAEAAEEALGRLESLCLRGKAATEGCAAPAREMLAQIDAALAATASGAVIEEETVRALYYYSKLLFTFYEQGLLERERDFEADERLARTLLSRIAPHAAPPDENDGAFGPSPAAVCEAILAAAFPETTKSKI